MKYYRQQRHNYQVRGEKVLHVNQPLNLLVLLSFDEFIISTEDAFDCQQEPIIEIGELEFMTALEVVLMSLEIYLPL